MTDSVSAERDGKPPLFPKQIAFFFYYLTLYVPVAITISFFPLWIRSKGVAEQQIGLLFALGALLAVVVNPLVGFIADTLKDRKGLLITLILGSTISGLLMVFATDSFYVFLSYTATRAFSAGLLPLSESMALMSCTRYRLDFGLLRSVGSVSVVLTSVALGWLVDRNGVGLVIFTLASSYFLQGVAASLLPRVRTEVRQTIKSPLNRVLRLPSFLLFLATAAPSQACHGLYYSYSALLWKDLGVPTIIVGFLWGFGVLVEVITFALVGRLSIFLSAPSLIFIACLGGAVRWGILAEARSIQMLIAVQLLQGVTLSFTQFGAAQFIRTAVPTEIISSATGIYAASTGLLTAFILFAGSRLFSTFGGRGFFLSSLICLGATFAAAVLRSRLSRR